MMKWPELKEYVEHECALAALVAACVFAKIAAKIVSKKEDKEFLANFHLDKIKSKNHHIRICSAPEGDDFIVFKPKGLLKTWQLIEKTELPNFVAEEIGQTSCTNERKKQLISKAIDLKTFW